MTTKVLILPGYQGSGENHWQTLWERQNPGFQRVEQRDWAYPRCREWLEVLDEAVNRSGPDTLLVAHSLACLLVVQWAATTCQPIRGAFLVAPPDPDGDRFPSAAEGFDDFPRHPLPFRSRLVASTNDPFGSFSFAESCAGAWGSELFNAGAAGHINVDSRHGEWPSGWTWLRQLIA